MERAEKVRKMKEELEKKVLAESDEPVNSSGVTDEERERIQQLIDSTETNEVSVGVRQKG